MIDQRQNERLLLGGNSTKTEGLPEPVFSATEGSNATSSVPVPSPSASLSKMPTAASSPTIPNSANATSPASAPSAAAPVPFPARFPTAGDSDKTKPASSMPPQQTGVKPLVTPTNLILAAVLVGAITLLLFWKFCKAWKVRREKQRLRLQSTRVDQVLGDMQMVGMDEYDGDDPELI
eukprot:jgi/Psemu1/302251/fgenesh1_kg.63_\